MRLWLGMVIAVLLLVSCASKPEARREISQVKPVTLVPREWMPSLEQAQAYVEQASGVNRNRSQTALNLESQSMADLADAQLFITYVLLMQRLDDNDRSQLFNEQTMWLARRAESARAAVVSKGGSLEALEYASAFRGITEKRLAELDAQLSRQTKQEVDHAGRGRK